MFEAEFTVHRREIEFEHFNEPFYLIPFGDVHRFAFNCAEDKWLEFLDWCKRKQAETGRVYFLGMGDYDDIASTSERYALTTAKFHSTTMQTLDDVAKDRSERMAKELQFMAPNMIGMLEGNHHYKFSCGITSTQLMCERLRARYLGVNSFIRLTFKYKKGNRKASLDIMAYHGSGGGKRPGSSVNNVEDFARVAEADIYLAGHDHKKWAVTTNRLRITDGSRTGNGLNVRHRKILLARTGSFQLGYVENKATFVSSGMMAPTDLGVVKIELTPKQEKRGTDSPYSERCYIDIHASI